MYAVSSGYKDVIYSGDAQHRLKLLFNNVEYVDANSKAESVKIKSNIFSNGETRFCLDNLVSKTAEIVIHDIDLTDIVEPVTISIGTLVGNDYEYVPMGQFLLDEIPTTDKGKTTIKLRDFASKFDIPYNAEDIITNSGGSATLGAILQDICDKAGVLNGVGNFPNSDVLISVWDNSITARQYVMYIAEVAGRFATMDRDGKLDFINPVYVYNNRFTLPVNVMSAYTEGEQITIDRVVYEDAIRKFEYGDDESYTLYINTSNPFVVDTQEISNVYDIMQDYDVYSMKIDKMMGNPALDPYDMIEFTYNGKTYNTFAQNDLTYNRAITQTFNTQFGTQAKSQENVTLNTEDSRYKRVETKINQLDGTITQTTAEVSDIKADLEGNYYTVEQTNILIQNAQSGITNTFSEAGGNNIFRNTGLWFANTDSDSDVNPYEFWNGKVVRYNEEKAANRYALLLQDDTLYQEEIVPNGNYTVSFKYKVLNPLSEVKIKINDKEYELTQTTDTEFITGQNNIDPVVVSSQSIKIQFISDTDNSCEIYDLMVNAGQVGLAYSQNQNETTTDTVNISKGITITSTADENIVFKADYDGVRIYDKNNMNTPITKFTEKGMTTKEMTVENKGEIAGVLIQEIGNQTWFTKI